MDGAGSIRHHYTCTHDHRQNNVAPTGCKPLARNTSAENKTAQAITSFRKGCGFSASPATGLVGMRENVFLSNFFD
ncbi:unnamed protein product, partial [Ectocarpus sp. 12 AP-2014]